MRMSYAPRVCDAGMRPCYPVGICRFLHVPRKPQAAQFLGNERIAAASAPWKPRNLVRRGSGKNVFGPDSAFLGGSPDVKKDALGVPFWR